MTAPSSFFRTTVGGAVLFAAGYAIVDLVPVLTSDVLAYKGLRLGDVLDAIMIFVLVALYVRIGVPAGLWATKRLQMITSLVLVSLIQGHAIHLTANAIAGVGDTGSPSWAVTYFLDEHWGHAQLHLAILLMAFLFIRIPNPRGAGTDARPITILDRVGLAIAVLVYGVLLAGDAIEGQTVPLMLPASIGLFALGLGPARDPAPLYGRFFSLSLGVTAVSLVAYGLLHGGFPELSAR